MAAVNKGCTWKYNTKGAKGPLRMPILCVAGATTAIKSGEICDISSGHAVPLASDKAMAAIIVVADSEIRSGDLAGYRMFIVPQEGDVFEYALATAAAPALGASLYWSDSQTLATAGTNVLAYSNDESIFPIQNPQATGLGDAGTTIRTTGAVKMCFKRAASYLAALQV